MSTTPAWFTLLVAALGILGSGATAILTQRRADRREDIRWAREIERERDLRSLDAQTKIKERRQVAYLDYLKRWEEHFNMAFKVKQDATGGPAPKVHLATLYPYLVEVQVFGTQTAASLAQAAHKRLDEWSHSETTDELDDFAAIAAFQGQVRSDLNVPD